MTTNVEDDVLEMLSTSVPMRYTPNRPQRMLHRVCDPIEARYVIANAGRRGSKTQGGGAETSRRILRDYKRKLRTVGPWRPTRGKAPQPYLRYGIVAPTYALLDEPKIALQRYLGRVEEGGLIVEQGDHDWWLRGGVKLDMLSGDNPKRLVSHQYNGVWLEEAARMKAAVWTDNLQPTTVDNVGWALFTTTPLGRNWVWEEVWAKANPSAAAELAQLRGVGVDEILDDQYRAVSWRTADNDSIPHLAREMARAEKVLPRALFLRNYYASFEAFAGQLFDLDARRHMTTAEPPSVYSLRRVAVGGDLGMRHRTSFTLAGEDRQRVWHEYDTITGAGILFHSDRDWDRRDDLGLDARRLCWTVQLYRLLRRFYGDSWRIVPVFLPADRPDVAMQFTACGFQVRQAYQEHEPAVSYFQALFYVDRFKVRTMHLWRSLQNLRVPEAGKRSSKIWVDEDDDEWDGLRYALSEPISLGDSPIEGSLQAMGWFGR